MLEMEEFKLLATVARRIWLRCNFVIFGGEFQNPVSLVQNTKEAWEDFYVADLRRNLQWYLHLLP
jgi:hypothetical protein